MSKLSTTASSRTSDAFAFFTNRKINTKIAIGFAVVLVLMAILATMSYRGFGAVSEGFESFNQRVKVVGIARDVDRGFVAFRRFVREYALSGDEKLVAQARSRQQDLAKVILKDPAVESISNIRLITSKSLAQPEWPYNSAPT